ncbi:MAG: endopeptidase La [Acidobacteriota bacterium]|nr:endopeptidase La [Acidobacteriota bacterium]
MTDQSEERHEVDNYPLLTLKNVVVFPGTVKPLLFSSPHSLAALRETATHGGRVFVVTMKVTDPEELTQEELHEVGTIGKMVKLQQLPNGAIQALFEAQERGGLLSADFEGSFFTAKVKTLESRESADVELPQLVEALKSEFFRHLDLDENPAPFQWNLDLNTKNIPAGEFADAVAPLLKSTLEEKQEVLSTLDTRERVELVYRLLLKEVRQKEFEHNLKSRIEEQMAKRQREYYLHEKMKAIQDEMGESDLSEAEELRVKVEESGMPDNVKEIALKELKKLRLMGNNSHEATPVRNYVDWLVSVPWRAKTTDDLSVTHAQDVLDEEHFGLEKPKERIIEYIAVTNAVGKLKGPIICFSGPPGVGKTSLAKSIAHALNRKFARIALGGVRDEAEIRGHRRTYIGALPGKIIQTMKKVGTSNPVVLLDEIDKISQHYTGGPTAAMLEVLDPEQNHTFMDHYMEVEYDLSKVLFICTANDIGQIPLPLRDRMEIIELSGYTELEKVQIARRYLIPKQKKENGLQPEDLKMSDHQVLETIRGYTREAGVRNLERTISKICRKAVTERLKTERTKPIHFDKRKMHRYLGPPRFLHNKVENTNEVGTVTGLAWTSVGGETLTIEVTAMKGTGKVLLTGTLGDVMKESAQAAISYVRTHANHLGIYSKAFREHDIHIHVPAGGTPKDGPSAGIALTGAIVSAFTGIPVNWNVALTGEVTLLGKVLAIGGLKEKLLAAKRADMETVFIPLENKKDLSEIPVEITKGLEIRPIEKVEDIFPILLARMPIPVSDADLPPEPRKDEHHETTPVVGTTVITNAEPATSKEA